MKKYLEAKSDKAGMDNGECEGSRRQAARSLLAGVVRTAVFSCLFVGISAGMALCVSACAAPTQAEAKKEELEFTVVSEERLPEELLEIVESKKENAFKVTYADEGYLYICMGYGKQDSGGYSVTVNDLYETDNAVYVSTNLLGPKTGSTQGNSPSYPYIVLKVEFRDKTVVFD